MSSTPNTTTERRLRLQFAAAAATLAIVLAGGCERVINPPHTPRPTANPFDDSAHPLSDDQAMAQVVEAAKQIAAAAELDAASGGFSFESCNDQGDPPYRGTVTMHFLMHGEPDAYFEKVQNAMVTTGWKVGAPPGQAFHGTALNKDGVVATIGYLPSDHSYGEINLAGECRNATDHHHDGKTNGTDITGLLPKP